jgi:ArsR family transcriptional regulator
VVGVDQSAEMLKAAAKRTTGLANVELRQGALEELPIRDGECDAALLLLVLSYTSDPGRILGELTRILRPGGRAVIVDLVRHDRDDFRLQMGQQSLGFDRDVLNELLEEAGLTAATFRELAPEPRASGPALFLSTAARPSAADPGCRPRAPRPAVKRTIKKKRRQIA